MSISQMGLLVFSKNEGGFFFSGGFAAVRSRSPPAEEDRDGEGDPSDAARAGDRRPTRERARASARTRRAVGASAGGASVDIAAARRGVAARVGRRSFVGKTASVSIRNVVDVSESSGVFHQPGLELSSRTHRRALAVDTRIRAMAASTLATPVFAARATRASRRVAKRTILAPPRASASDEKAQLAEMRRQVQLANMNPSQENVVGAILELAAQEFGLAGVKFSEIMDKVGECYVFDPSASYVSGKGTPVETENGPGVNMGSLKTYYFAHLHGLDEASTLRLFCEHYKDVLDTPDGDSHANIRAFMVNGWDGIEFEGVALRLRDGDDAESVDQI
jgi:hypothetical protein